MGPALRCECARAVVSRGRKWARGYSARATTASRRRMTVVVLIAYRLMGKPVRALCGCLLERDGVAEALELGDEAFGRAGGVAAAVVVGTEVVVELAGGEHVPGCDEHRVFDGADCLAVADARALAFVERA